MTAENPKETEAADDAAMAEMAAADNEAPETEVDEAPEPEPAEKAEGDKGKPKKGDEKPKMVDHRALVQARGETKAEREARKAAEARAERMERRYDEMQKRLAPTPKAEEDPEPDFNTAPADWLKWDSRRKDKVISDLSAWKQAQERGGQQSAADAQFYREIAAAEEEFASTTADYSAALAHAQKSRLEYLKLIGMSPAEAMQTMHEETKFVARLAIQQGVNPAQRMYNIAKSQGYVPGGPKQTGAEKIEQLARGQNASSKMAGGGDMGDGLSLKALADIEDDAEFDKEWEKMARTGKLG
jgi:hypothetical protein